MDWPRNGKVFLCRNENFHVFKFASTEWVSAWEWVVVLCLAIQVHRTKDRPTELFLSHCEKDHRTLLMWLLFCSSVPPHFTSIKNTFTHQHTNSYLIFAKEKVDDDQSNGDATGLESCFENYANMAIILLGLIPEHRGLGTRKKSCFVHSSFRPMPNRGRRIPEPDGHSRCCCSCGRKLNFMENSVKRNH